LAARFDLVAGLAAEAVSAGALASQSSIVAALADV
jgi:hypothetical protein